MDEGARLENGYPATSGIVGSNPTPSASETAMRRGTDMHRVRIGWIGICVLFALTGCARTAGPPRATQGTAEPGAATAVTTPPPIPDTAQLARFTVENLTCLGCLTQIAEAVRAEPGVLECATSYTDKQVLVVFDPAVTTPEEVARAIGRVPHFAGGAAGPYRATLVDVRTRTLTAD